MSHRILELLDLRLQLNHILVRAIGRSRGQRDPQRDRSGESQDEDLREPLFVHKSFHLEFCNTRIAPA